MEHELNLINKKLDLIISIITPKLSEIQDKEVLKELFLKKEEDFTDILIDPTTDPDNFNANTDRIINDNKII